MKAVTTQDRWAIPPRSPTMRGRAVLTMFWSSAASSMASRAPAMTTQRRVAGATPGCGAATRAAAPAVVGPAAGTGSAGWGLLTLVPSAVDRQGTGLAGSWSCRGPGRPVGGCDGGRVFLKAAAPARFLADRLHLGPDGPGCQGPGCQG